MMELESIIRKFKKYKQYNHKNNNLKTNDNNEIEQKILNHVNKPEEEQKDDNKEES